MSTGGGTGARLVQPAHSSRPMAPARCAQRRPPGRRRMAAGTMMGITIGATAGITAQITTG